jgi:hypothetical protein
MRLLWFVLLIIYASTAAFCPRRYFLGPVIFTPTQQLPLGPETKPTFDSRDDLLKRYREKIFYLKMRRYGKRWRRAWSTRHGKRLNRHRRLRLDMAIIASAKEEEKIEKAGGRWYYAAQTLKTSLFRFAKRSCYSFLYVNLFSYL